MAKGLNDKADILIENFPSESQLWVVNCVGLILKGC